MFGVHSFTAIVNAPQAAILAVGAASPPAVSRSTARVEFRETMLATLSADHRIVYGADGAAFLSHLTDAARAAALPSTRLTDGDDRLPHRDQGGARRGARAPTSA